MIDLSFSWSGASILGSEGWCRVDIFFYRGPLISSLSVPQGTNRDPKPMTLSLLGHVGDEPEWTESVTCRIERVMTMKLHAKHTSLQHELPLFFTATEPKAGGKYTLHFTCFEDFSIVATLQETGEKPDVKKEEKSLSIQPIYDPVTNMMGLRNVLIPLIGLLVSHLGQEFKKKHGDLAYSNEDPVALIGNHAFLPVIEETNNREPFISDFMNVIRQQFGHQYFHTLLAKYPGDTTSIDKATKMMQDHPFYAKALFHLFRPEGMEKIMTLFLRSLITSRRTGAIDASISETATAFSYTCFHTLTIKASKSPGKK